MQCTLMHHLILCCYFTQPRVSSATLSITRTPDCLHMNVLHFNTCFQPFKGDFVNQLTLHSYKQMPITINCMAIMPLYLDPKPSFASHKQTSNCKPL